MIYFPPFLTLPQSRQGATIPHSSFSSCNARSEIVRKSEIGHSPIWAWQTSAKNSAPLPDDECIKTSPPLSESHKSGIAQLGLRKTLPEKPATLLSEEGPQSPPDLSRTEAEKVPEDHGGYTGLYSHNDDKKTPADVPDNVGSEDVGSGEAGSGEHVLQDEHNKQYVMDRMGKHRRRKGKMQYCRRGRNLGVG